MLLGEIDLKGNAIKGESMNDHTPNAKKFNKNESKGIIAMAGDPVPVDRAGKKVNNAKEVSQGLLNLYNTLTSVILVPSVNALGSMQLLLLYMM